MNDSFEFESMGVPPSPLCVSQKEVLEQRLLAFQNDPIVVAPYAKHYQEHVDAIATLEYPVVRVPCPDRTDYFWLMYEAWSAAVAVHKSIVVIEHDIVPKRGQIQQLLDCDYAWCGYPYTISTQYRACMGFTCYSKELIERHPTALAWVSDITEQYDGVAQRDWVRLDTRIDAYFNEHGGYEQHTHWPPVAHLNPQQHLAIETERGWCAWPPQKVPDGV